MSAATLFPTIMHSPRVYCLSLCTIWVSFVMIEFICYHFAEMVECIANALSYAGVLI
jgi:vacuolar-type H+-ATPase subunit I/STV1